MDTHPLPRTDGVLAILLSVAMGAAAVATGALTGLEKAGVAVVACGLLALGMRRRRPLSAMIAVAIVIVVDCVAAPATTAAPAFVALMVASYSIAVHGQGWALVAGFATAAGAVVAVQEWSPPVGYSHVSAITFFVCVLVAAPAALGGIVRLRRGLADRLRLSAETIRSGAAARLAARRAELWHDAGADIERIVVTGLHSMRPHAEVRDLADVVAVRDLGRDVLGRLRGLLTEWRHAGGDQDSPHEPAQRLSELRAQVQRVLAAGAAGPTPAARNALRTLLSPARIDVLLTVSAGTYALLIIAQHIGGQEPLGVRVLICLAGAASALPFGLARRWPFAMTTLAMAAVVAYTVLAGPAFALAGLVAGANLIAYPLVLGAALELVPAAAGVLLCLATGSGLAIWAHDTWSDLASSAVIAAGSWAAGRTLRTGAAAVDAAATSAANENEQQQTALRNALAADRARVARDLHDAVGHAMTGIVLQASAAVRIWDSEPAVAHEHVTALRQTLAEALDELRPLVTTIAIDDGAPTGTAALSRLVDRARNCGLSIDLIGESTVDATTYRIVQEALTNAARYAPGSTVTVRIDASGGQIEVTNTRPPYQVSDYHGSGHGLRGIAERAAACRGTLDAGPTCEGGFRVRVTLPMQREAV